MLLIGRLRPADAGQRPAIGFAGVASSCFVARGRRRTRAEDKAGVVHLFRQGLPEPNQRLRGEAARLLVFPLQPVVEVGVRAGNSAVVVDLPLCGPMLSPRVPNLVPIPGPRMQRETPGQRPRPNYGHPQPRHRWPTLGRAVGVLLLGLGRFGPGCPSWPDSCCRGGGGTRRVHCWRRHVAASADASFHERGVEPAILDGVP